MEFVITILRENNQREVVSRHNNKQEALEAGSKVWKAAKKSDLVDCISGDIDDDGRITGKYWLYHTWH